MAVEEVEAIYQTQTAEAICVRADESSREDIWLPKSFARIEGPRPERGEVVTIAAPGWLLTREGLL